MDHSSKLSVLLVIITIAIVSFIVGKLNPEIISYSSGKGKLADQNYHGSLLTSD